MLVGKRSEHTFYISFGNLCIDLCDISDVYVTFMASEAILVWEIS